MRRDSLSVASREGVIGEKPTTVIRSHGEPMSGMDCGGDGGGPCVCAHDISSSCLCRAGVLADVSSHCFNGDSRDVDSCCGEALHNCDTHARVRLAFSVISSVVAVGDAMSP